MASKSKNVRIEQLRIFEKKLALRLQQLDKKGISKEKAQKDPLVKSLKSKIRETNVRIAAFDKFVQLTQELAQAKVQKLAELAAKKEEKSKPAPRRNHRQKQNRRSQKQKRKQPKPIKNRRNNRRKKKSQLKKHQKRSCRRRSSSEKTKETGCCC